MCETIVTYFCKFTIIDVHVVSLNFCNIFIYSNFILANRYFGTINFGRMLQKTQV
jgi:hypothetical protein